MDWNRALSADSLSPIREILRCLPNFDFRVVAEHPKGPTDGQDQEWEVDKHKKYWSRMMNLPDQCSNDVVADDHHIRLHDHRGNHDCRYTNPFTILHASK
mmetsp:Transcript_7448/g.15192  ORF Transcript_7448/g.15192 Transcript_7448/m.15192 type:complete len:100 (+) Transcript_7448:62-361(+)